jgi:two-component system sensor histidine kinase BaeS
LIAVVVTALVAVPLARRAAIRQERQALGDQADTIGAILAPHVNQPVQKLRLARQLSGHGVALALVQDGTPDASWVPDRVLRLVTAGRAAHGTFFRGGRTWIVEGRPLTQPNQTGQRGQPTQPGQPSQPGDQNGGQNGGQVGAGDGVVLAQPIVGVLPAETAGRLVVALVAGGLAGLVAGVLLAQGLSRPVRRAAAVARRIGAGDRTARLPVTPPAEIAELAGALNGLSTALDDSENRQREFLLSVSHELRTPLTTIRGYGEALADGVISSPPTGDREGQVPAAPAGGPGGPGDPGSPGDLGDPGGPGGRGGQGDAVRHAGEMVVAEAARLDRLISDLLALARLTAQDFPVELVDVDLAELARTAVVAWGPRCADAGLRLRAEVPGRPVWVRTDPGRIRQVLDGLLENAFRVVPAGGPLVVAVGAAPGVGVLEVRDGGPGLSDEDLAVAFERGRLYQKYQGVRPVGTGLGLVLAARLVHRLGGRIEAGHAAEGGARFTVALPAVALPGDPYRPRTRP